MRLLLIRHGDPDYVRDSLTKKGDAEAALLADLLSGERIDDIYISPLGRAQRTASYTLKKLGKQGVTKEWLHEFSCEMDISHSELLRKAYPDARLLEDGTPVRSIPWDMLPSFLMQDPRYLDPEDWKKTPVAQNSNVEEVYSWVTSSLDDLLADYGYRRDGGCYRVLQESDKTVAFFCHFGVSCVLLSHLWNCSPFIPWQFLCMQPSSVTELVTEEREQGTAVFRALRIGDVSHLYAGGEKPSFMGRFCELYSDKTQRH
ncbi:MAG: phosphoglycerate mutase family protein [Eubacterium sp.]|nr:phosphoglycerate mutase family protein [Eubacterium sp.]